MVASLKTPPALACLLMKSPRIAIGPALIASMVAVSLPSNPAQAEQKSAARSALAEVSASGGLTYYIAACYPHDTGAFTQGLIVSGDEFYESTGQVGRSTIRRVRIADGKVLKSASIRPPLFGEGLTDWKTELISITWRSGQGFRWNRKTLRQNKTFTYKGEGWGLTQDGKNLILSDGTPQLKFLDPESFEVLRTVDVTIQGKPLARLNELEWVDGAILANVWGAAQIIRIDPASGVVTGILDMTSLADAIATSDPDAVLNGIAYDAKGKRLFVTGKNWPWMFELRPGAAAPTAEGCAAAPDAHVNGIAVP